MLSEILSIAIGVFFVYLLLSLICSTIVEWIAKVWGLRARTLEEWVHRLLGDTDGNGLSEKIYAHPLIKVLTPEGRSRRPSHIPPNLFAIALAEAVVGDEKAAGISKTDELRQAIADSDCCAETKRALDGILREAGEKLESALRAIGRWFDDPMDMVVSAYRGKAARLVILVALAATLLLNLDTIMIAGTLWENCDLRARMEMAGAAFVRNREIDDLTGPGDPREALAQAVREMSGLNLPLGWSGDPEDTRSLPLDTQGWLKKILGLFATIVAASLGAPFWFDMLQTLVGLRRGRTSRQQKQEADDTKGR